MEHREHTPLVKPADPLTSQPADRPGFLATSSKLDRLEREIGERIYEALCVFLPNANPKSWAELEPGQQEKYLRQARMVLGMTFDTTRYEARREALRYAADLSGLAEMDQFMADTAEAHADRVLSAYHPGRVYATFKRQFLAALVQFPTNRRTCCFGECDAPVTDPTAEYCSFHAKAMARRAERLAELQEAQVRA